MIKYTKNKICHFSHFRCVVQWFSQQIFKPKSQIQNYIYTKIRIPFQRECVHMCVDTWKWRHRKWKKEMYRYNSYTWVVRLWVVVTFFTFHLCTLQIFVLPIFTIKKNVYFKRSFQQKQVIIYNHDNVTCPREHICGGYSLFRCFFKA